jgi:polyhydroxybutyrate depolymerase
VEVQTLPNVDDADGTSVNTQTWSKCASGAPVVLYRIAGGGHRIPGRREDWPVADVFLGKKNGDFEAAYAIWNFFKNKKR